jgi:serine/threonine protein kinase
MCFAFSGNLWSVPDEKNDNYKKFMKGWASWIDRNGDTIPTEETDYPKCGNFMKFIGPPAIKKLVLRMMHPNPNNRITIRDALNSAIIKGAECCSPESFEDVGATFDASKLSSKKAAMKMYKHNHIPPKEAKVVRAFTHRFDMGDGYT